MNLTEATVPYRIYLEAERQLKANTVRAYLLDVLDFARVVGDMPVGLVSRDELRSYMRHMKEIGRARATIQRRMWG